MAKKPETKPKAAQVTPGQTGQASAPEKLEAAPGGQPEVAVNTEAAEPSHAKQSTRLVQMEHAVMTWHHVAQPGEPPESFLHPQTWSHVTKQLQVGHEIIVVAAESTWRAHLYVRAVGRVEAHVGAIHLARFGPTPEVADDIPYEASWRGPHVKWSVVSKETGQVVRENFQTIEVAKDWIRNHMKALAS